MGKRRKKASTGTGDEFYVRCIRDFYENQVISATLRDASIDAIHRAKTIGEKNRIVRNLWKYIH